MNALRMFGNLLLILGLAGVIWGGFDYYNDHRSVQLGDTQVVVANKNLPLQGVIGVVMLVAGALTRAASNRSRR